MAAIPTWLWTAAGWTLIAFGAALVLRGRLLRGRTRKPHCPKCGYSAEGLATLTCPECGFIARSDRQRMTKPRRRRWRAVGIVVASVGWLLLRLPSIVQNGWPAGIPDWGLAFIAPKSDGQPTSQTQSLQLFGSRKNAAPSATPVSAAHALEQEALRRLANGTFSHPFADWYLRRCAELTPGSLTAQFQLPVAWPWDAPVDGVIYKPSTYSFPTLFYTTDRFTGPARSMRIHVTGDRAYDMGAFTIPVDATRPLATFFTLKNDRASNDAVRASFHPILCAGIKHDVWIESTPVAVDAKVETPPDPALPAYAGLRMSVMLGDQTLGTTNIPLGPQSGWRVNPKGAVFFASIWWKDGARQLAFDHLDELELHLQGDTDLAWETFRMCPRTQPVAWTGSLRVKPATVRRTQ